MNERQSIRRALEPLHASPDTLEEVLDMISREQAAKHIKRAGRGTLRGALIAAILVIALSVTAYAVGEYTGFFDTVFGDEAIKSKDPEHVELTDEEGSVWADYDFPGQERVPVDQDMAEEVIGDETVTVGKSVTVRDVTFTVEDLVMDENGVGMLTYTMESPNGFPGMTIADDGRILFDVTAAGSVVTPNQNVLDESGEQVAWMDEIEYAIPGGDGTKITAVRYFCPAGRSIDGGAEMSMRFCVATAYDPETLEREVEEGTVSFPMAGAVKAETLTGQDGWSVSLSPVGLKILPPEENPYSDNYGFGDLIVHMADGTDYALKQSGSNMVNFVVACSGENDEIVYVFNRLIDPAEVESVTAVGAGDCYQDANGQIVPYDEAWTDTEWKSVAYDVWIGGTLKEGLTALEVPLDLTFTK